MTALLLGVGSLNTGAGIVLLLPELGASGYRANQTVIPVRVKIESPPVL
jgi:hypothetical protein